MRLDLAQIDAAGEVPELDAEAPEELFEQRVVGARQIADVPEAAARQLLLGHGPDAPDAAHGQRIEECAHAARRHLEQAVGLGRIARDLRDHLHRPDPDRHREPGLRAHPRAQALPHVGGRTEQALGAREVEERLVEREAFDRGREVAEYLEDGPGLARVLLHVSAQEDEVRAQAPRLVARHRRVHAEDPRLVARGRHDAPRPLRRRPRALAAQLGMVALLDRGVERVHVRVEDAARASAARRRRRTFGGAEERVDGEHPVRAWTGPSCRGRPPGCGGGAGKGRGPVWLMAKKRRNSDRCATLPRAYVELRTRSAFSFLEGVSNPEDLIDRAAALDYPALALGDRGGVYGAPRFPTRRARRWGAGAAGRDARGRRRWRPGAAPRRALPPRPVARGLAQALSVAEPRPRPRGQGGLPRQLGGGRGARARPHRA